MEKPLEIEEIEEALGLYDVQPIKLTPSESEDTIENEQELIDWYEYELRYFLESQ